MNADYIIYVGEKIVHKTKPIYTIHHNAKSEEVRKWLDSLNNTIPDSTKENR